MNADDPSEVGQPRPANPRRGGGLWKWFAGLALLLVLLGADASWRNVELDRLVDSVESAKPVMKGFEVGVGDAFGRYRNAATRTPEQEAALLHEIGQIASDRASELDAVRDRASDLLVAPWHRSARNATGAYLAYLDALLARLRDLSREPRSIYQDHGIDRNLGGTSRVAEKAFRDAVPTLDLKWFRLRGRIENAFFHS